MPDPLQHVADRCSRFIINAGTKAGVTPRDLARYIDGYRALCLDDRFRVNVLVCKTPGVAYASEGEELDGFRFWPKAVAPDGART